MSVTPTETALQLTAVVNDAAGGVAGLAGTVQIRDQAGDYLDFNDNIFKSSGWTSKTAALIDLGAGFYNYVLDLSVITLTGKTQLIIEYIFPTAIQAESITIADILQSVIDGTVDVEEVLKRLNAYMRGEINLTTVSGTETDVEYLDEGGAPLFTNRKAPATRTPQ